MSDLILKIEEVLRSLASEFSQEDLEVSLENALKRYSKEKPLVKKAEITGDGTKKEFKLPDDFYDYSDILGIEYPVDESPPSYLENGFIVDRLKQVVSLPIVLQDGEKANVYYSTMHTVDTIYKEDIDAVINLSASYCIRQLALKYLLSTDSTISADSVDRKGFFENIFKMADKFEEQYTNHIAKRYSHFAVEFGLKFGRRLPLIFHST